MGRWNDSAVVTLVSEWRRSKTSQRGSSQGFVLGPILWNMRYVGILRLYMKGETLLVGFDDDPAMLIGG